MAAAAASTFSPGRLSSSQAPLPTPFWFSSGAVGSGSAPASCQATIIDPAERSTSFCCNGQLIDITQPILGPISAQHQPFYFDNLRCCSGDPDVALGSVTSCSSGSAAMLASNVAEVMNKNSSSSGMQVGVSSTSTSTVLLTTQFTTTETAASSPTSTNEGRRLRAGTAMCILTMFSILLALAP